MLEAGTGILTPRHAVLWVHKPHEGDGRLPAKMHLFPEEKGNPRLPALLREPIQGVPVCGG